jgi:transcriptional regulator with XRE-family HTH domain
MPKTQYGVWHQLRVTRERSGFSSARLAREANMSAGYLSDLENGKRWPNATVIKKLCTALNCPYVVLERHDRGDEETVA